MNRSRWKNREKNLSKFFSFAAVFFIALVLFYLSLTPGTIEGMGYTRENLIAASQLAANTTRLLHPHTMEPVAWPRHGAVEPILELPFALAGRILFGDSIKWLGRLMIIQPILFSALLCTVVFLWIEKLMGCRRWACLLALATGLSTMIWPYAYIGLETSQSFFLLLTAYLAIGRKHRFDWIELIALAMAGAIALNVKQNGVFLAPALGYLFVKYFLELCRNHPKSVLIKFACCLVFLIGSYLINAQIRMSAWSTTAGGDVAYATALLVKDPLLSLMQAFAYFGSPNKSLLIFAPIVALGLLSLGKTYRTRPEIAIFALLVLGGLVGGFSLISIWAEETWGPRYLHATIAPMTLCLAAAKAGKPLSWRNEKPLILVIAAGFLISFLGTFFYFGQLHKAATTVSQSSLENLQYDVRFSHLRFNSQLFGIWANEKLGRAPAPVFWPQPEHWWFERPLNLPAERQVDLRGFASPQPLLFRPWLPHDPISSRTFLFLRIGCALLLGSSLLLFGRLRRQLEKRRPIPAAEKIPISEKPLIAICMATFNPPPDLFRRQIESIVKQSYQNWVCIISDDASKPESQREIESVIAGHPRIIFAPSDKRLGFYHNFERALTLAPPEAELIALSDQDDCWRPDKLQTLRDNLARDAVLAYSDMRIVGSNGDVVSETYWTTRKNNYTNLASLLLANTITGAASLFHRRLLSYILPFPPKKGNLYHDHWIAAVALTVGKINYVDRPLYDYIQHSGNVIGHNTPPIMSRPKLIYYQLRAMTHPAGRRMARQVYFKDTVRIMALAQTLERRCAAATTSDKRNVLQRLSQLDHSPLTWAWLALRGLKGWRKVSVTFGSEYHVMLGVMWKIYLIVKSRFRH